MELLNDELIKKLEKLVDSCVFSAGNITILKSNEYDSKLQQIYKLKKERDKASKDYLNLYNKVEKAKVLLKDLVKKNKYKIDTNDFTYIFLDQLGDLKSILDVLERDNEEAN